ncbi:MAG: hypothetical protein FOGNACKC_04717 [Anaerolineae bacterium]|mgnify:CR=1 FL=1|nr:hypothetical protein [Anaerolineae bacterium]
MADRVNQDPFVECFFGLKLEYPGMDDIHAYFKGISGGEMEIALIEHNLVFQNGGSTTLFIPGPTSFAPITLSHGVTSDMTLWKWWTDVTKGKKARRSGSIYAFGYVTGQISIPFVTGFAKFKSISTGVDAPPKIAQWDLSNVWPLSISGFNFDLDSGDPFIAEITLVAESIERIS